MMLNVRSALAILMFVMTIGTASAQNRTLGAGPDPGRDQLLRLADSLNKKQAIRRSELERIAKEKGWVLREETKDGVQEIQFVDEFGYPQAYHTTNLNAGRTTNTDDIWVGGSTGLNLTGSNYLAGEWDGGGVLTTHQEFDNGAGTRVTQMDAPGSTNYHSTHVAGTICAEGQVAAAHGMATQALLHAYEWTNDATEMANEAAGGLTLSNHSYGLNRGWNSSGGNMYWWGNPTISATEDYLFGFYDSNTASWDNIAFNAPNYLIVKASGNDRNDTWSGGHYYYNGTSWVYSTATRDQDGGADGYDCIEQYGVAKNILTVGAVNDIPGGWTSPADVVQSSFSSWGPTDDGRIKPDIVANGVGVYSCNNTGNDQYTTLDGTSMATPNTTGTLVLLQQHYKNLRGGTMSAAALKGLVINTANEAGAANGPDYQNGWGLLNASGAASLITTDNTQGGQIVQGTISNGQTIDYTYYSDGLSNINVTLSWTDLAGTPPAASLNPTNLMLVNDLDMRLIKSTTTYPWVLNPAVPSAAATKSDNFRDNVETINLLSPVAGYYTIRITHKGTLTGGQQAYALIVNGMTTPPADTYCKGSITYPTSFEYIKSVVFGTITNLSGRSPGGYHDYTGRVDKLIKGYTQTLTVATEGYTGDVCMAWIDWNQDGDFNDAGETYTVGSGAGPVYSLNITAPMTALPGYTTMRIRHTYGTPGVCDTKNWGETEDYAILVLSACEASGGCDEYISRVQAGTIDNSTACNNYTDYTATQSTNLPVNGVLHVTVTNGNPVWVSDQCGIWVDWNGDSDFSDANETITVTGTPGVGPYTATIFPPAGQTMGNRVMRVRIMYTGTLDPCGTTSYGEVEDYNLNLTAAVPNQWAGMVSNDWFNPLNWTLEHIPAGTDDVTISTGYTYYPIIGSSAGYCNNLTLNAGTKISIGNGDLVVNGSMGIYGQAEQTNINADFFVTGDVIWYPGSTANILAGEFWVQGNWEFRNGSNAQLANGYVMFEGTLGSNIRNYTTNCSFNHLSNYKTGSGYVNFSAMSSDTTKINGDLTNIFTSSSTMSYSAYPIRLKGAFSNNGSLVCLSGTFIFDGTTHTVNLNTGDYFNNLVISSTGATTLADSLRVHGNLLIESGSLAAGAYPIIIEGNWTNQVGTAGFSEGTGKVVFDGPGHQYVLSSETFNILEAKMGAALRVTDPTHTVTCNQYLWTSGGIDVLSGTFTALDLAQNGIYGGYWLNPGGTINLTNNDGYVDINGNLHIYGGTFNVYGGNGSYSFWPYAGNGGLEMNAGMLDFKTTGVYVFNTPSYTFAENITGGTIRSSAGFQVERADFSPSGGTVELYGPTDGWVYTINGSNLYTLKISKYPFDNSEPNGTSLRRDRETGAVSYAPMSTTITVTNSLDLNGDMLITEGTLNALSNTINVAGLWSNPAGTGSFLEGTSTVVFDGASQSTNYTPEDFYNLTVNKTFPTAGGLSLAANTNVLGNLSIIDGNLQMLNPVNLNVDGNLSIAPDCGLNANWGYGGNLYVGGNWSDLNSVSASFDYGFYPGTSMVTFDGSADQVLTVTNVNELFYDLTINKSAGKFRSNKGNTVFGNVNISSGTWEDNVAGLTHFVYQNFTVGASGVFNTTTFGNTVQFVGGTHSNLYYYGAAGYFRNISVNKNIGYSVAQYSSTSLQLGGNLNVASGYYIQYAPQLLVAGDITVGSTGVLNLQPAANLLMTDTRSINVNSGGKLEIQGTLASPAVIRGNVTSARYNLNINSGAIVAADYGTFKNMTANGVNVASGATVDAAHAFYGCTFQDGASAGTLLTVNNSQTLTVRNATFPTNSWGGSSNVSKTVNSGTVYFVNYSGAFSGEAFDNDAFNRVNWVATLAATPTASPTGICAGSSSQLNAGVAGGLGPYTYLWSPATGLSSSTIVNPVATPPSSVNYSVTVTGALGTTATGSVSLLVNSILPVGVTIAASANPSPPGNFVQFTASPVNGGPTPTYQWKVNGVNVGSGGTSYTYVPNNHDVVTCVMTSNYPCTSGNPATSNAVTMAVVNTTTTVTGTIPAPLNLCFDASNTITVAGGATTFIVQSGASATLIAGQKISFLPGTRVMAGGYMHGYITLYNAYCGAPVPLDGVTASAGDEESVVPTVSTTRFSVYPNPTTGRFTLEQKGGSDGGTLRVEIMDLRGSRVLSEQVSGARSHRFDLGGMADGVYLVRVVQNDHVETFKVVLAK